MRASELTLEIYNSIDSHIQYYGYDGDTYLTIEYDNPENFRIIFQPEYEEIRAQIFQYSETYPLGQFLDEDHDGNLVVLKGPIWDVVQCFYI